MEPVDTQAQPLKQEADSVLGVPQQMAGNGEGMGMGKQKGKGEGDRKSEDALACSDS